MTTGQYGVSATEGQKYQAKGLQVRFEGAWAWVICKSGEQREIYWAGRLAYLKANPQSN